LFFLALMGPGLSHASCVWRNFSGQLVGPAPLNFNFGLPGTVSVSPNAVVGDVLASATVSANAVAGLNCNPGPLNANTPYRSVNSSTNNLMATGVAGVEFRMILISNGQPYAWNGGYYIPASTGQQVYTNSGQYRLELVKTAHIKGGTVASGQLSATSLDGTTLTNWYLGNNVNIVPATCSISTPSVSVDLGTVSATEFTGVGSTSATTKPFSIRLNCTGVERNVSMTLTDATTPSNRTNTLSLAAGSSATGVGLQILRNGTPVSYGADTSAYGGQNQFFLDFGINMGANGDIPFTVRYVKTGASIGAGSANGLATFTLSYW